jgi:inhibitor of cysteine peptidase
MVWFMFKDNYKKDMEIVTPSPESLLKTKEKMIEACEKKPRRLYAKPLIAVAACLVLVSSFITFSVLQRSPDSQYKDIENPYITRPGVEIKSLSKDANLQNQVKYDDIYNKIKPITKKYPYHYTDDGLIFVEDTDLAEQTISSKQAPSLSGDYSDTNNQVAGVQEADIIKTDGKYIYACGNTVQYYSYYNNYSKEKVQAEKGRVYILSADNGKLSLASAIMYRSEYDNKLFILKEILLYENTLVLIKEGYSIHPSEASNSIDKSTFYYWIYRPQFTSVEIYDITDRANPVFKNELYQSGSYFSSRMIGSDLYIVTNHYVYNPNEEDPSTYIPFCSAYDEEYLIPASCIFVPENVQSSQYIVITGTDINKPDNHKSSVATLGFSGTIYASEKNIYVAAHADRKNTNTPTTSTDSETWTERYSDFTDIYRFSINDGIVNLAASSQIKGNLINQFAMDEYNDAFRVAVTVNEYAMRFKRENGEKVQPSFYDTKRYNSLYILDMELNITGSVTDLAPNERIYSVRFDGEIGYVVTFRQTDPLFAIDLSNTTAPKVLSELKIPGFSTYMHPYGDGLLFGIGLDADENGRTTGLKMSMFDITDKVNVTEKSIYKLSSNTTYSEALYNHKAILIDAKKNIIGFPVSEYNYDYSNKSNYKFYKYDNNEFVEIGSILFNEKFDYSNLRGLYIGNYIYIYSQNQFVNSYDMNTFAQVDSYKFN